MRLTIEQFAEMMMDGRTEACWSEVRAMTEAGYNSLFVYEQLLAPAMNYIGDLWEQNLVSVADEHLASAVCEILLSRYGAMTMPASAHEGRAMLLCVEGEGHALGLKMAHALFREHGWDGRCFGAGLPLRDTLIHAMKWKPDVVALSAADPGLLPTLAEYVETLNGIPYAPVVMVGGRALLYAGADAALPGRATRMSGLAQLQAWLEAHRLARSAAGTRSGRLG